MKTLSFHDYQVGRSRSSVLLTLDSRHGVTWSPGLHLIVAPNGYGKSTLFQTMAGLLAPIAGSIHADGVPLRSGEDVLAISEYLSFPKFVYPTEWIEFVAEAPLRELESLLQPWVRELRLEAKLKTYLGRMSQGERRKTTWLAAHASQRPLVLLDEPLDGLDLLAVEAARRLLLNWKERQRIVAVVAHQVGDLVDLSDEVWLIREGRLVPWRQALPGLGSARDVSPAEFRERVLKFYAG